MWLVRWIALGLGTGLLPKAPGTWGALLGVFLFWGLSRATLPLQIALVVALSALGAYCAGKVARALGQKDPKAVVIDEVAGQIVALLGHPTSAPVLFAGFVLFRLFDILKPPPVRQAERLSGGMGII